MKDIAEAAGPGAFWRGLPHQQTAQYRSVWRWDTDLRVIEAVMADASTIRLSPFRTAPNLLTLLRICLVPLLVAAVLDKHYALGLGLFVAAGSPTRWTDCWRA